MKYIKIGIMFIFILVTFYFSDKLLLYVENLSPLMKSVKEHASDDLLPVNAIIDGNTIIPGKKGKSVNIRESYLKMNEFRVFNETFYVYDYIKPDISLDDNLDKVIIKGSKDNLISIIVDNKLLEEYLLSKDIKFNKVIKSKDDIDSKSIEYINGNKDIKGFEELNLYFKRDKINKKICLIGYSSNEYCYKNNYYKVKPSIDIYSSNLVRDKNNISSGDIVFIHDNLSLSEGKILINSILSKRLEIVYLSDLISE